MMKGRALDGWALALRQTVRRRTHTCICACACAYTCTVLHDTHPPARPPARSYECAVARQAQRTGAKIGASPLTAQSVKGVDSMRRNWSPSDFASESAIPAKSGSEGVGRAEWAMARCVSRHGRCRISRCWPCSAPRASCAPRSSRTPGTTQTLSHSTCRPAPFPRHLVEHLSPPSPRPSIAPGLVSEGCEGRRKGVGGV